MVWILDCSRDDCSEYLIHTGNLGSDGIYSPHYLRVGEAHTMILELFMGLASLVLVALAIFIGILKFTDKEK